MHVLSGHQHRALDDAHDHNLDNAAHKLDHRPHKIVVVAQGAAGENTARSSAYMSTAVEAGACAREQKQAGVPTHGPAHRGYSTHSSSTRVSIIASSSTLVSLFRQPHSDASSQQLQRQAEM
jgi:hypothetical protein